MIQNAAVIDHFYIPKQFLHYVSRTTYADPGDRPSVAQGPNICRTAILQVGTVSFYWPIHFFFPHLPFAIAFPPTSFREPYKSCFSHRLQLGQWVNWVAMVAMLLWVGSLEWTIGPANQRTILILWKLPRTIGSWAALGMNEWIQSINQSLSISASHHRVSGGQPATPKAPSAGSKEESCGSNDLKSYCFWNSTTAGRHLLTLAAFLSNTVDFNYISDISLIQRMLSQKMLGLLCLVWSANWAHKTWKFL